MDDTGQRLKRIALERFVLVRQRVYYRLGKMPLAGQAGPDLGIRKTKRPRFGFGAPQI